MRFERVHTQPIAFHRCNDGAHHLFNVQPDVPAHAALECACLLLDAAEELAVQATSTGSEQLGYACGYLIEMARAAMQACLESDVGPKAL